MSEVSQSNEQLIEEEVRKKIEEHENGLSHHRRTSQCILSVSDVLELTTWLHALLEENKRLTSEIDRQHDEFYNHVRIAETELEQVKAERDSENSWKAISEMSQREVESLRTELSAKDSALGDIADYQHRWSDSPIKEVQKIARSILSQYGDPHE